MNREIDNAGLVSLLRWYLSVHIELYVNSLSCSLLALVPDQPVIHALATCMSTYKLLGNSQEFVFCRTWDLPTRSDREISAFPTPAGQGGQ